MKNKTKTSDHFRILLGAARELGWSNVITFALSILLFPVGMIISLRTAYLLAVEIYHHDPHFIPFLLIMGMFGAFSLMLSLKLMRRFNKSFDKKV